MTESEFRIKYSELVEYYQYIEMRLKFICGAFLADNERGWLDRLNDIDSDPFGTLLRNIKEIQDKRHVEVLKDEDFVALGEIREKRNYWVHQCFGGRNPIVFPRGQLKNPAYGTMLIKDLDTAIMWDEKLVEIGKHPALRYR